MHTLPALTEASRRVPAAIFDWVAEEAFAAVPSWHPAVERVIPVALRRWRRTPWRSLRGAEWKHFKASLREQNYDRVIDAQGLWKSALLSRYVDAPCYGFDRRSAREPWASLCYRHRVPVSRELHAVERLRRLFAASLGYELPAAGEQPGYGLERERFQGAGREASADVVFLHGASRPQKLWPEERWRELCALVEEAGYSVSLPWGNAEEHARALRIAAAPARAQVLPRLDLFSLAGILAHAAAVVAVDSGLGHLSAALGRPVISLYGVTDPARVGTYGAKQTHLRGAAMHTLEPHQIWCHLEPHLPPPSARDNPQARGTAPLSRGVPLKPDRG